MAGQLPEACVQDPATGCWYRYRTAFVDLDLKSLGKIPGHRELDRRIVAAARAAGLGGSAGGGA